jgi:hypothetical protein
MDMARASFADCVLPSIQTINLRRALHLHYDRFNLAPFGACCICFMVGDLQMAFITNSAYL